MRIKVEVELRRPSRRAAALLLGVVLVALPGVVLAGHQFPDVPNSNPFHGEIDAIAEAGITAGFADGGYHPSDAVTRQAMAAFMERGFGRVGMAVNTPLTTWSVDVDAHWSYSDFVTVRDLTITVPGASNGFTPNQLVYLQGHVTFYTEMSSAQGCPCVFTAFVHDLADNTDGPYRSQTFAAVGYESFYSFELEALFAAPPGPRTYQLRVTLNSRASNINAASFALDGGTSLSAMTFPFGPTGSNTAAPGAANQPADVDQLPQRRAEE